MNEKTLKSFSFSQINYVLGPSNSGKTTYLEYISDVFQGKEKQSTVNGLHVRADDYNVIYVPSKENVSSHLKLSSKSLVRKAIESAKYSDDFSTALDSIKAGLSMVEKEASAALADLIPGSSLRVKAIEDPLSIFMDEVSVTVDDDSTSLSRSLLFRLVTQMARLTNKQTIIIIDDFDNDLNEDGVSNFLAEAKETDACFILSSRRPTVQFALDKNCRLHCVRNSQIIEIPDLEKFLLDSIDGQPEYVSFEEYMLGRGYSDSTGMAQKYLEHVRRDQGMNFLRIITSSRPILEDEYTPGHISIVPRCSEERKTYEALFSVLGLPLNYD